MIQRLSAIKLNDVAELPDYPLIPHSDCGDPECCGCIVPSYRGSQADLVCNECGLFFQTVAANEVAARLAQLAPELEICNATCPHCGSHNVFTGFSSMIAFRCRHCGRGVVINEQIQ
jgi:hypothetical protein